MESNGKNFKVSPYLPLVQNLNHVEWEFTANWRKNFSNQDDDVPREMFGKIVK